MADATFTKFIAVEDGRDGLVGHLLHAAELVGSDPACRAYVVGSDNDRAVYVFEEWDDEASHDASLERDDVRMIIDAARPLISDIQEPSRFEVHGGTAS